MATASEYGLDLDDLDRVPDIACIVRANDLAIVYLNPAWLRFGSENGASASTPIGTCILDAMPAVLREFYATHLARVIADDQPWEHDYECASPSLHREFRLRAVAVGNGAGILMTHMLRVERPHPSSTDRELGDSYRDPNGLVVQCAHCRRVRRASSPRSWHWVPAFAAQPAEPVSHGLCEACFAYYFSPAALR